MRQTGVVGVGKVILRRTQHLAGVRVVGEALVIELMRFANELVDISDYSFPGTGMLREQELTMAKQLVENLASRSTRRDTRRLPREPHEAYPCEDEG
jgi:DNA end-binding protein Ku